MERLLYSWQWKSEGDKFRGGGISEIGRRGRFCGTDSGLFCF